MRLWLAGRRAAEWSPGAVVAVLSPDPSRSSLLASWMRARIEPRSKSSQERRWQQVSGEIGVLRAGAKAGGSLDAYRDGKGAGLAGGDGVQADLVFRAVGWAHPGFDAIEGSGIALGPGDDGVAGVGFGGGADLDLDAAVVLEADAFHDRACQLIVDTVADAGIRHRFDLLEAGYRLELSLLVLAGSFFCGKAELVVLAASAFGPGQGEVEVVASGPGDGDVVSIGETEFDAEFLFVEAVDDFEVVLEWIRLLGFGVGNESGGEALFVDAGGFEGSLAGEAVHGHGASNSSRVGPTAELAVLVGASGEGEKDGIAASDLGDPLAGVDVGPANDVAEAAVGKAEVPVHEAGAFFGPGQKGGCADLPAVNAFSEILYFLHGFIAAIR